MKNAIEYKNRLLAEEKRKEQMSGLDERSKCSQAAGNSETN